MRRVGVDSCMLALKCVPSKRSSLKILSALSVPGHVSAPQRVRTRSNNCFQGKKETRGNVWKRAKVHIDVCVDKKDIKS